MIRKKRIRQTAVGMVLTALVSAPPAAGADVAQLYKQNCSKCHGMDGKGQTTVGRKFKVSDMTDPAWKTKTTDDKIKKAIEEGTKDSSGKEVMAPFKSKLSPEDIDALVKYVKALP
jgi:mono/diheme cytochrome c family protein